MSARRPVALALFLLFLVALPATGAKNHAASTTSDPLQQHRAKLEQINERLQATRQRVKALKQKENAAVDQLSELQQKLERTSVQLEDSEYRLDRAQRQLTASQIALGRARRSFAQEQTLASDRVRSLYKSRQTDYWEALLTAPDLVQFMTRYEYFRHISERDAETLNQLNARAAELTHEKRRYGHALQTISTVTSNIRQQKAEIADDTADQARTLSKIRSERAAAEAALAQLERDSQLIEAMIRRMMAARRHMPRMGTGRLMRPVDGSVGDTFGMRYHPILHVYRPHRGLDFRASSGTPVMAADRGVVYWSGWYGSYGKLIILDHGGDMTTLYAHCSRLIVNKGDVVNRGQLIGYTGTTGLSTGPHLHFEVRVNGVPVDPLSYLR